jgi:hypothetical protein
MSKRTKIIAAAAGWYLCRFKDRDPPDYDEIPVVAWEVSGSRYSSESRLRPITADTIALLDPDLYDQALIRDPDGRYYSFESLYRNSIGYLGDKQEAINWSLSEIAEAEKAKEEEDAASSSLSQGVDTP